MQNINQIHPFVSVYASHRSKNRAVNYYFGQISDTRSCSYSYQGRCGGRWADAWFNLGLACTTGACFILVGPVWGRCAGVAGAWFLLTGSK